MSTADSSTSRLHTRFLSPNEINRTSSNPAEQLPLLDLHPHAAYRLVLQLLGREDETHSAPAKPFVVLYRLHSNSLDYDLHEEFKQIVEEFRGVSPNLEVFTIQHVDFVHPCEFQSIESALAFAKYVRERGTSLRIAVSTDAYAAIQLLANSEDPFVSSIA